MSNILTKAILKLHKKMIGFLLSLFTTISFVALYYVAVLEQYAQAESFLVSLSAGFVAASIMYYINSNFKMSQIPEISRGVSSIIRKQDYLEGMLQNQDIQVISKERGEIPIETYERCYRNASKIKMVGVALNDFISNVTELLDKKNGSLKRITELEDSHILKQLMEREEMRVIAIMASPDSIFVEKRSGEPDNENTKTNIEKNIEKLLEFYNSLSDVKGNNEFSIKGSLEIMVTEEDLDLSMFISDPSHERHLKSIYYGMIIPKVSGTKCPMIAVNIDRNNHSDSGLHDYLYDKYTTLQATAKSLFTWNHLGPEFNVEFENITISSK